MVDFRTDIRQLSSKMKEYEIQPENIYNMDEKGFLIGVLQKTKRVWSKSTEIRGAGQDGNREWITIMATICMDGSSLPPTVIYQSDSGNLQDAWLEDFSSENVFFTTSPNGWTSNSLAISWLTEVFDRHTKSKAGQGRDWRLLLLDGHGSHMTMEFLEWCSLHRILVAIYPPHSTHRLQPLDVSIFNPLAHYYSEELNKWIHDTQGTSKLGKAHFFSLFWPAFQKAFTIKNIASAWRKTGLLPFDPEQVLSQIRPQGLISRPSSSDSTHSGALLSSYWPQVSRLLKAGIGINPGPKLRRVANTLEHFAAENDILRAEIQGLKRQVIVEKRRKIRSKPLFDSIRDESKGLISSPRKIQEAKELKIVKENEKEKLAEEKALEKEEKRRIKETNASKMAQKKEEKQQTRLRKAKEIEEKRAAKLEEKMAKKTAEQVNKDLNKQLREPLKKDSPILIQKEVVVVAENAAEAEVAVLRHGRLGRELRLPARLR